MTVVRTERELAGALTRGDDTIEIEGDLSKKSIKIRATGKVAWAIAIRAISISVYAPSAMAAPAILGILDGATTYSAIAIASAAGEVGALTRLRNYKEISRTNNKLVLKKR